jgi:hypothetical protein
MNTPLTSANDANVAHHFNQLVVADLAPRVLHLVLLLQVGVVFLECYLLVDPFLASCSHGLAALFLFKKEEGSSEG